MRMRKISITRVRKSARTILIITFPVLLILIVVNIQYPILGWNLIASSSGDCKAFCNQDKNFLTNDHDKRIQRAQNFCFDTHPGSVWRIVVDKNKKLANCIVPKAGCTFWINIFRYINNETHGRDYQSPSHIPRWITHYGNRSKEYYITKAEKAPSFLRRAFRFMFVRDPYKRLWAVWIDKFLLPDFWFGMGNIIAEQMHMGKEAEKCPINITFVDFLLYITDTYFIEHPKEMNEHWAPIHKLCDPCVFRPHFIGKMETFEEDSDFVLAHTNLSWIQINNSNSQETKKTSEGHLDEANDEQFHENNEQLQKQKLILEGKKHDEHILHEMYMLGEYTFAGVWSEFPEIKKCVSQYFVAQRLWLAFQSNGYIPKDCPLQLTSITAEAWNHAIHDAYSKWDRDFTLRRKAQQEQKRNAMVAAYENVSADVMMRLIVIFKDDFKQFGYNPFPKSLFKINTGNG